MFHWEVDVHTGSENRKYDFSNNFLNGNIHTEIRSVLKLKIINSEVFYITQLKKLKHLGHLKIL